MSVHDKNHFFSLLVKIMFLLYIIYLSSEYKVIPTYKCFQLTSHIPIFTTYSIILYTNNKYDRCPIKKIYYLLNY